MAAFVSTSTDQPPVQSLASVNPFSPSPASTVGTLSSGGVQASAAVKKEVERPRAVMLGHWHQRTWDAADALNAEGSCQCVAAVTDLLDALVVLKAAIPSVDLLVCSSYFELEDVQEMLLDYEGDLKILIAPPNLMNTKGPAACATWVGDMIAARSFYPKTGSLSSNGFMRRLSQNSNGSGSGH